MYVASQREKRIAVANLAQFRAIGSIPVDHPASGLAFSNSRVYAPTSEGRAIYTIDPEAFKVVSTVPLIGRPIWFQPSADGRTAVAATIEPAEVLRIDLESKRVTARIPLPAAPAEADSNGKLIALTLPQANALVRVSTADLKIVGTTPTSAPCRTVRFRQDGRAILAGSMETREILTFDAETGALMVRLPLPVEPERFCFNQDGGQMFVSGPGEDTVAIVSPYQNEVGETMLAGRTPGEMAVSPKGNLVLVANPGSGDLTILDIDTRHLSASVHTGGSPGPILITPDNEYALTVDSESGGVAVVRLSTVLDHKVKTKPLFTQFPTVGAVSSAIIVPFDHPA